MKRILFVVYWVVHFSFAQTVSQQLTKAFAQFENHPQLKAAIASLYVIDIKTSRLVFEKNAGIGLGWLQTSQARSLFFLLVI